MGEEAESAGSSKRREVDDRLMNEKDPPPYGAQQRQDALWEGGNEALPPQWQLYELGSNVRYQDDDLMMVSWNRPLPGVRLDYPGYLVVSGWEWHISPQGRSYFVNHNTRTTSWKKPIPERPTGSLTPECIIDGHSECIWSLACVGTSYNVMSASEDGSIRQWTTDGKPVGKPWRSDGGGVCSLTLSPDGTMVVSGSVDGRLRLWNLKEGRVVGDPLDAHKDQLECLDWSLNGLEIASGSKNGTVRRWNPNTGRQIGPTIDTGHEWVNAIKYSPQSAKFVTGGDDSTIRVWSKDGKLLIEIKGHDHQVNSLCWSKDGAHIFSGSGDRTIRKWQLIDGKEVFVLRGHTHAVTSICVTLDEHHLISASTDYSVRIWDLKTNQQVGDALLHDDRLFTVVLLSDGRYIASAGVDKKISIWSLEAALKQAGDQPDAKLLKGCATSPKGLLDLSPRLKQQVRKPDLSRYGDDFWGNDTNRTRHHSATLTRTYPRRRNFFDFLRFTPPPIVSRTSTRSQRTAEPIAQSSTTTSSAITPRLYILSKWWPIHTSHVLPPVVDVPLTRGDQRNATAGAPKGNGGYKRDEDFDPPPPAPTGNITLQQPPAAAQTQSREQTFVPAAAVTPACDEDRYAITHQRRKGPLAAGAQLEAQTSAADAGDSKYVIGCCGFVVHRARP